MLRYGTIALLAAALSVAAVNPSQAGWVKIGGHYVFVPGKGDALGGKQGQPWHPPQASHVQRVLTAPIHTGTTGDFHLPPLLRPMSHVQRVLTAPAAIHTSATGPARLITPMRRR
jgi:hypothetical protein